MSVKFQGVEIAYVTHPRIQMGQRQVIQTSRRVWEGMSSRDKRPNDMLVGFLTNLLSGFPWLEMRPTFSSTSAAPTDSWSVPIISEWGYGRCPALQTDLVPATWAECRDKIPEGNESMPWGYHKGDEVCPAWLATEHLPDGLQKTEIWDERLKSRDLSLLETDLPVSAESVSYSFCKHFLPF